MAVCVTNFRGSDDDFVIEVQAGRVMPTRVGITDEHGGAQLVMVEFPDQYGCQLHMHVQTTGEIIGHVKSNGGDRHNVYQVHLALILERLQTDHGLNRFPMIYR